MHFETYTTHLKTHKTIPTSKCIKCGLGITLVTVVEHLKKCHGFGDIQCCFCRFGTDAIDNFTIHIANKHPNKMLWYFDRSPSTSISPSAVPTVMKTFFLFNFFLKCYFTEQQIAHQHVPNTLDLETTSNISYNETR